MASDSHFSSDESYDGYVFYDTDGEGYFPEDFGADLVCDPDEDDENEDEEAYVESVSLSDLGVSLDDSMKDAIKEVLDSLMKVYVDNADEDDEDYGAWLNEQAHEATISVAKKIVEYCKANKEEANSVYGAGCTEGKDFIPAELRALIDELEKTLQK